MQRQNINIANFEYICDLYTAGEYAPVVYKEFVIIRNISFSGNVSYDTDVYFLEKSVYEKIKKDGLETTTEIVFPCFNSNFGSFSRNYKDFASMLDKTSFKLETEGGNVFSIYKNLNGEYTNENVGIKCDKIKIYHPHNKTNLDYIIYLDNVINGIHFHYLCNYNINYPTHSESEFKIHNNIYSEYIEVYIPNTTELFSQHEIIKDDGGNIIKDDNVYFNDFYNITKYIDEEPFNYKKQSAWISLNKKSTTMFDEKYKDTELMSMLPMYLLLNPFVIYTNEDNIEEKIYYRLTNTECNNYNAFPINITLYPYTFSTINDMVLMADDYPANSDTFIKNYYFKLVSNIGFSHGQLCVINKFNFNNRYDPVTNPNGRTTQEAYALYNGLKIEKDPETGNITCPKYEEWYKYRKYSTEDLKKLLRNAQSTAEHDRLSQLIEMQEDTEYSDDFGETCQIKCCGYQIDIATDFEFKNIIASDYQEMVFIDDFEFSLLQVFDDWYKIPGTLIIRIKFIDKYLGITINTGNILLTKEWLKYSINLSNSTRLFSDFVEKQNNLTKEMAWNKINAKETTFNFIDKINCIVDKSQNNNININNGTNGIKVIYKPIFYKVQQLQTISVVSGLKQKIGINLSNYMTKIELFKLIIEDNEISEYGRNDIYVIFEVNANSLENTSGTYNIVDNNDNYISSGNYVVS